MAASPAPIPAGSNDVPDVASPDQGILSAGSPASLPQLDELRAIYCSINRALLDEGRATSTDRTVLGRGLRLRVVATGVVYAFSTPRPIDTEPGDPALLHDGQYDHRAIITRGETRAVELTLAADFGPTIPEGWELVLDPPWLLERLRQRVFQAFREGVRSTAQFNLPIALRVLGIGQIAPNLRGIDPQYEDVRRPLNEEQAAAVQIAFRSPLSVIAAPAGTGKTVTLGAIVEAAYRAGMRVLVCAPSHVAVDLTMMQVAERLATEPHFSRGHVLRVGGSSETAFAQSYGDSAMVDLVVARLQVKLQAAIAQAQAKVDDLAAELTRLQNTAAAEAPLTVSGITHDLEVARVEFEHLQRLARRYARSLVSRARVVGATLARVFVDDALRGFDVVIIDETSMAVGPAVFIAAGQARRHVVVAGDPYQLGAPVASTGPDRHWLVEDTFQKLDVVRAIQEDEYVEYLTVLREQRRCAEGICDLQREIWYGPSLRTAREVMERERQRANVLFGTNSICYVDTGPLHPLAYHPWGRTFANDEHAALILDLIAYIASAGELPAAGHPEGEILVLSHYRGQVAAVRRALGKRYRGRGVAVRTVHRAQGSEATTAILDLTLAANVPARVSSVLTAIRPDHDGSRLLAVAASRARSRLIVVGDLEWIERSTPHRTVLRQLIAHLREHGYRIPIDEIRPAPHHLQVLR